MGSNTDTAPSAADDAVLPTTAINYAHQAEKLSLTVPGDDVDGAKTAIHAHYITPQDPIIITGDGGRLPGVPLAEADKLNRLKAVVEGDSTDTRQARVPSEKSESDNGTRSNSPHDGRIQKTGEGSLRRAMPPSRTNPLFPPLPLYGPSSLMRDLQCLTFRVSSFFLSGCFLATIVLGAAFTSLQPMFVHIWLRLTFRNPDARRPFYEKEKRLKKARKDENKAWKKKRSRKASAAKLEGDNEGGPEEFIPTEGGPDPLVCDVGYYARRVGLDMEAFKVQTEDGFIIELWHIYNPLEFKPMSDAERAARGPNIFTGAGPSRPSQTRKPKFPILMIHGLLQSSGAYCTNDDRSLAFYLCKSGYDVWLGNNRCGFHPDHTLLSTSDPRMWAWNIRQMGVMDLPALTSRVLSETGFEKLGLIAHSQGTTQTLVALAKEQRPELGEKLTVFCALAPAAYAGPLIGKAYFKFMRLISPAFFRIIFGIHAFIPIMMTMHRIIPGKLFGAMGYVVFHFLFNWSDDRWDRGLRDRCFQFAPVYVSAESMRWWLGRECFAKQKCILATREEGHAEDAEDEMEDYYALKKNHQRKPKGSTAWYNEQVPPFALWVTGSDDLVDGRRLLRRFERGREPHVRIVHSNVIEEYEHLDVIWAMDCIEKVGREIKEVLWKTCDVRDKVRVPKGCEDVDVWRDPKSEEKKGYVNGDDGTEEKGEDEEDQSSSDSRSE
ncbi:ab-hydrolase associated lipase-like protein [Rhexocercosporidium sp. MPI-PUGE-AT-0058]|nr:ab-hydrolase associated lipase-like protein [Rhexocercosporidium sp. MPI-PUGE-AT-0058]